MASTGRGRAATAYAGNLLLAILICAVAAVSAACGGSDPSSGATISATDLDGKTYRSASVIGHDLVAGSSIVVSFEGDTMTVSAGCNTMTGAFAIEDGRLRWTGHPATTLMACPEELMDQDVWLTTLFTTGLDIGGDTTSLTLTQGKVVIELASQPASG